MPAMPIISRWRYSLVYFWYFAALGAYTPYVSRWVDGLGHSGYVVGMMLGLWFGTRIVSPSLWGALVQRSAHPGRWFVFGAGLTLLSFAAFTAVESAVALLVVMAVFGLFYNAILPQFEAMTLGALGARSQDYGRLRLWGSVGFLLTAASYGYLLDHFGDTAFPWLTLPLLLAFALSALLHRQHRVPAALATEPEAGHLWRRPGVRRFLLVALLMQLGFGPFYVFYTLHLQAHGHNGLAVGLLWAVGVLIEIVLFWFAPGLIARFGAARLLSACLAVTALRWVVTAVFAASLPLMLLAQATHALGFAMFHACCMQLMTDHFPGRRQTAGQGLLYGFSSGVGGVLGAGMAALLWEGGGGQWAFLGGAFVVMVALLIHALRGRVPTQSNPLALP